jgi:hypothetical protein
LTAAKVHAKEHAKEHAKSAMKSERFALRQLSDRPRRMSACRAETAERRITVR